MFKKLIVGFLIVAHLAPAAASQNYRTVNITFTDGTTATMVEVPRDVPPQKVEQRVRELFPNKEPAELNGGWSKEEPVAKEEGPSTWSTVVAWAVVIGLVIVVASVASKGGSVNPCDYSWQTASDGSRCGARAANVRPGGR